MKRSMLYTGIGYAIFGGICIIVSLIFEFRFEGFLWGLGGAGIGPGIMIIWKYIYWSKPQNRDEYNERLRVEKIEMYDERKIMLRDKSGGITYRIMLGVYCVLTVIFSILSTMGYFTPFSKYIVMGLCFLMILQFVCGLVVYHSLNKRF